MLTALVIIFVLAYAAIALEHPLKVNKTASALIGAGLLWTVYAMLGGDPHLVSENLKESVAATAQIVFFLMGTMTIVGWSMLITVFLSSPRASRPRNSPPCSGWWALSLSFSVPSSTT